MDYHATGLEISAKEYPQIHTHPTCTDTHIHTHTIHRHICTHIQYTHIHHKHNTHADTHITIHIHTPHAHTRIHHTQHTDTHIPWTHTPRTHTHAHAPHSHIHIHHVHTHTYTTFTHTHTHITCKYACTQTPHTQTYTKCTHTHTREISKKFMEMCIVKQTAWISKLLCTKTNLQLHFLSFLKYIYICKCIIRIYAHTERETVPSVYFHTHTCILDRSGQMCTIASYRSMLSRGENWRSAGTPYFSIWKAENAKPLISIPYADFNHLDDSFSKVLLYLHGWLWVQRTGGSVQWQNRYPLENTHTFLDRCIVLCNTLWKWN